MDQANHFIETFIATRFYPGVGSVSIEGDATDSDPARSIERTKLSSMQSRGGFRKADCCQLQQDFYILSCYPFSSSHAFVDYSFLYFLSLSHLRNFAFAKCAI